VILIVRCNVQKVKMEGDLQLGGFENTVSVQYISMFLQKHYDLNIYLHEPTATHNIVCLHNLSAGHNMECLKVHLNPLAPELFLNFCTSCI
jgi:hypothetical protein